MHLIKAMVFLFVVAKCILELAYSLMIVMPKTAVKVINSKELRDYPDALFMGKVAPLILEP